MDGRISEKPENCATGKIASERNRNAGYNRGRTDIGKVEKVAAHRFWNTLFCNYTFLPVY
ncbi:hypothetical protein [Sphingobacterium multivorum]|uniref:hypothetical protein n=1 Tax=Sphingobacterium multivorum TaxID=28454 RepID=UPI003DA684A1